MRTTVLPLALSALFGCAKAAPTEQLTFSAPHARLTQEQQLLAPGFEGWAEGLLGDWGVPGAAVGVIKIDQETGKVHTEFVNVGTAGRGRNVTEDTLFGIASNSKAFTAAAVAQLVDAGKLNWTTPVSSVLPTFGLHDSIANEQVMVKDILSHRTGLPRHDHSYHKGMTHAGVVGAIKSLLPSTGFREEWQYNNQMFMTAAYLVSQLRGKLFTDVVAESIFEPLGMSDTTYTPHFEDPTLAKVSSSYVTLTNKTVVEIPYGFNATGDELQMDAGAGGVVTSTRDALKWLALLINQRKAATAPKLTSTPLDDVLSPAHVLEMSSGQMIQSRRGAYPESSAALYGFGLEISHYQGVEIIRHGGSIPGFGTQIVWSSELGIGTVAFCNTAGTGNALSDVLSYRAFDNAARLSEIDWNARYHKKMDDELVKNAVSHTNAQSHASIASQGSSPPSLPTGLYFDPAYGAVVVCGAPEFPTPGADCAALYTYISGALPSDYIQPLEPLESALLIASLTGGFFGTSHIALRYSGEEGVWKGQYQDIFGLVKEDGSEGKVMAGEGENDGVEARFSGDGFELSGVWGAGAGVKQVAHQTEVRFAKVI